MRGFSFFLTILFRKLNYILANDEEALFLTIQNLSKLAMAAFIVPDIFVFSPGLLKINTTLIAKPFAL